MTDQEPESLEETQARLAGYAVSPYGPAADTQQSPTPRRKRPSGRALSLIGGGIVVGAIAVGATVGLVSAQSIQWKAYPGSASADDDAVLAGDSMETVVANSEAMLKEYRDALTDDYGFTWTQVFDGTLDHDVNGYGGDSMLYYYYSGSWQGEVTVDDPAARQAIQDAFQRITTEHGGSDFFVWNDELAGTDSLTIQEFGASTKAKQALWSFRSGTGDLTTGLYVSSDVYDRNIPVDATFDGDYRFELDPSDSNTLLVIVYTTAGALLSEDDRDAYITAIAPYAGKTKPDPSN